MMYHRQRVGNMDSHMSELGVPPNRLNVLDHQNKSLASKARRSATLRTGFGAPRSDFHALVGTGHSRGGGTKRGGAVYVPRCPPISFGSTEASALPVIMHDNATQQKTRAIAAIFMRSPFCVTSLHTFPSLFSRRVDDVKKRYNKIQL